MKRKSLKREFISAFIKILLFSFILSVISIIIWLKGIQIFYYPANYYERQLSEIIHEINENHQDVLNKSFQDNMNEIIPVDGISYQVLDLEGNIVYGNMKNPIIEDTRTLYENLNSVFSLGGNDFARVTPIFNENNDIIGSIIFKYSIRTSPRTNNNSIYRLSNLIIFTPFVYIVVFTIFYSRRLSKNISEPINLLMESSEKIKNKDLDFSIAYREDNEIGRLCNAFEDMRLALKDSLIKQWDLEEKRRETTASIAHDLKTPLTVINTYSEALIDGDMDEHKLKEYIRVIKRNNERALDLLEDMNRAASIENTDFALFPRDADIAEFLDLKKEDYRLLCSEKEIYFKLDIVDLREKDFTGKYDIEAIENVLDNIVSNSIRYTNKDGIIVLNVLCKDDRIDFSVIDTGKGFSNEDLKNIFNKFYRGDKSRSFTTGHSGLGMYIAKTIVEKHGGSINARNNSPKGGIIEFDIKSLVM